MNSDALWDAVGKMLRRNQREEVDPNAVKRKLDSFVRERAAGRTASDLSVEEVFELGQRDTCKEKLPPDVAKLLGMKKGADYGDVFDAMACCTI